MEKTGHRLSIFLFLLIIFLLSGCREDRAFKNDYSEENFSIELPLTAYNFYECIELEDHTCTGDVEDVYYVSVLNSFELWNEAQLTFGIVPYHGDKLMLETIEGIELFQMDNSTNKWIEIPFRLETPTFDGLFERGVIFYSNCTDENVCTLDYYSPLVTLVFTPFEPNTPPYLYKLSVTLTNSGDGNSNSHKSTEEYTSTRIIEYSMPEIFNDIGTNWKGIEVDENKINRANQEFSLNAPIDINPFMINHPLHTWDWNIFLVLNLINDAIYDFGQDLNLQVYQFNQEIDEWVVMPPYNQSAGYSNVGEFFYSPEPDDSICTGCMHINEELGELDYLWEYPRLMNTDSNHYLIFGLSVADPDTIKENSILRIIVQTEDQMAYVDVIVRN